MYVYAEEVMEVISMLEDVIIVVVVLYVGVTVIVVVPGGSVTVDVTVAGQEDAVGVLGIRRLGLISAGDGSLALLTMRCAAGLLRLA